MMNIILKCVFLLFVFGLPVSAKTFQNCCQSFWDELKKKSEASMLFCSPNNQTYVPFAFGKDYCKSLKTKLQERWDAYHKLCPAILRNKQCSNAKSMIFKGSSIVDYVMSKGAPVMKAITACFWANTKQETGYAHYISYAVPKATNQLIVYGQANLILLIHHGTSDNDRSSSHNIKVNDGRWHHICVTWQSKDGRYSFYKDGRKVGSGSIAASVGKPLPGKGTWIFGQDQDSLGGTFETHQAANGEFTGVNIWDKVLSPFEIVKMSRNCESGGPAGNVKSWADFISGIQGNVKIAKPTCCQ